MLSAQINDMPTQNMFMPPLPLPTQRQTAHYWKCATGRLDSVPDKCYENKFRAGWVEDLIGIFFSVSQIALGRKDPKP